MPSAPTIRSIDRGKHSATGSPWGTPASFRFPARASARNHSCSYDRCPSGDVTAVASGRARVALSTRATASTRTSLMCRYPLRASKAAPRSGSDPPAVGSTPLFCEAPECPLLLGDSENEVGCDLNEQPLTRHTTSGYPAAGGRAITLYSWRPLQSQRGAGLRPRMPAFLAVWSRTTFAPPNGSRSARRGYGDARIRPEHT
jgi:hypothetical protein